MQSNEVKKIKKNSNSTQVEIKLGVFGLVVISIGKIKFLAGIPINVIKNVIIFGKALS